jgi:pimeloyl-ACP methyl ester carboxylesterase
MYCVDTIYRNSSRIDFINEVKDSDRDLVIMFHGFPDDSYGFESQIESLKEDYNVIVPFMHGTLNNTEVSDSRISLKQIILDVLYLIKQFNPNGSKRVILMGHDLGSFTAVGTYEAISYQVKAIVHINGLGLQQFCSRKNSLSQWLKSYYVLLVQFRFTQWIVSRVFPNYFLNLIYKLSKIEQGDRLYRNNSRVFKGIRIYKHLFKKSFSYLGSPISKIDVPTLFVWGHKDNFLNIPTIDEVNTFYKNAELRVLKGGHWAHHNSPVQFNRILNRWLGASCE